MTAPNATAPKGTVPNAIAPIAPRDHGITLWGAPGTGKSGLLGALYAAALHPDVDAWCAHPKDCEDGSTQERLLEAYIGLRSRTNTKTGLPAVGSEYPPLRVVLRRQRAGRADGALRVALVDPAGEFSTQLALGATPEGRALFLRIARGTGVVWLVDAEQRADDVEARLLTLQHLVALLEQRGGRQLAIPVALCLSKIDCLDDATRAAARLDPAAALRERMGETAFTWFEAACPSLRCFAISSAGTVAGSVQPEGLDAVFDWLAGVAQPPATLRETVRDVITSPRAQEVVTSVRDRTGRLGRLLGTLPAALRRVAGPLLRSRASRLVLVAGVVGASGILAARRAPAMGQMMHTISSYVAGRWRGFGGTASGEVVRPAITTRAISAAQAAERLARARSDASQGAWSDVVETLGDAQPPDAMRFTWDSLYVAAAASAIPSIDASAAQRLREAIRARATGLVRRGPAGSHRLVPVRYARAVACLDGRLACPHDDVVADLTWALMGPSSMRHAAELRLDALPAASTPPTVPNTSGGGSAR